MAINKYYSLTSPQPLLSMFLWLSIIPSSLVYPSW